MSSEIQKSSSIFDMIWYCKLKRLSLRPLVFDLFRYLKASDARSTSGTEAENYVLKNVNRCKNRLSWSLSSASTRRLDSLVGFVIGELRKETEEVSMTRRS